MGNRGGRARQHASAWYLRWAPRSLTSWRCVDESGLKRRIIAQPDCAPKWALPISALARRLEYLIKYDRRQVALAIHKKRAVYPHCYQDYPLLHVSYAAKRSVEARTVFQDCSGNGYSQTLLSPDCHRADPSWRGRWAPGKPATKGGLPCCHRWPDRFEVQAVTVVRRERSPRGLRPVLAPVVLMTLD